MESDVPDDVANDPSYQKFLAMMKGGGSGADHSADPSRVAATPSRTTAPGAKLSIRDTLTPDDIRTIQDGLKFGSAVGPELMKKLQLSTLKRSLVGDTSTMRDRHGIAQVRAAYPFVKDGLRIRYSIGFPLDRLLRELS